MLPRCLHWKNKPTSRVAQQCKKLSNGPQVFQQLWWIFLPFSDSGSCNTSLLSHSFKACLLWLYFGRVAFEKVSFLPSFMYTCLLLKLWTVLGSRERNH